jgi:hypothetical protein
MSAGAPVNGPCKVLQLTQGATMKYRKKPVVIEAITFDEIEPSPHD